MEKHLSAIASIALPDAAGTPVTHTFVPGSVKGDKGTWQNQSPSLPIGFELIDLTLTDPAGNSTVYRLEGNMKLPVLKTTTDVGGNSTTTVDYWLEAGVVMKIPARSTLQNRKDLRKLFVGLLGNQQFIDMAETLQHTY